MMQFPLKLSSRHLLLFDFDGLLVDTENIHYTAFQQMLALHGFTLSWSFNEYCQAGHIGSGGIRQKALEDFPELGKLSWTQLYEEKYQIYQSLLSDKRVDLMPGAEEILTHLRKKRIRHGIVTNATRKQIEQIQKNLLLLKDIPFWITREDVERPKPDPEGYLLAKRLHSLDSDTILGFEDTCKGAEALCGADIPGILICRDDHPQLYNQDLSFISARFASLKEVHYH